MSAEELQKFLDELAAKLTPAGSHLFELAVRNQVITSAIGTAIGLVLLLVGLVVVLKTIHWCITREPDYDWDHESAAVGYMLGLVAAIAMVFFGLVIFTGNLPILLDPEWYALKDIISQIPGK
jgi:hypothetical protein